MFSCNLRSFKPDIEKLTRAGVVLEDITKQTIPEDFARNPKIHHWYLLKRAPKASQPKQLSQTEKPGARNKPRPTNANYRRNSQIKHNKKDHKEKIKESRNMLHMQ